MWDPLGLLGGGIQWDQVIFGPLPLLFGGGSESESESGTSGESTGETSVVGSITNSVSGVIQTVLPLILLAVVVWLVLKYGKRLLK